MTLARSLLSPQLVEEYLACGGHTASFCWYNPLTGPYSLFKSQSAYHSSGRPPLSLPFDLSHITLFCVSLTTIIIMYVYLCLISLSPTRLEAPIRARAMCFFWLMLFPTPSTMPSSQKTFRSLWNEWTASYWMEFWEEIFSLPGTTLEKMLESVLKQRSVERR